MSGAGYLVQDLKGVCLNPKPYLEAVSEFSKQEAGVSLKKTKTKNHRVESGICHVKPERASGSL